MFDIGIAFASFSQKKILGAVVTEFLENVPKQGDRA